MSKEVMKWMYDVTRPILPPLVLSIIARIVDSLLGIFLVSFIAYGVFDTLVRHEAISLLTWVGLFSFMILLSLLKAWFRYEEQFRGHLVAFRSLELLRTEAFRKLHPQAPAVLDNERTGDLFTSITKDIDRIEVFFAHTIAPMISAVVVPILVCLYTAIAVHPVTALTFFVCYAMSIRYSLGVGLDTEDSENILDIRRKISHQMVDNIQGTREILGYQQRGRRLSELSLLNDELNKHLESMDHHVAVGKAITVALKLLPLILLFVMLPGPSDSFGNILQVIPAAVAYIRSWELINGVQEFSGLLGQSLAAAERVYDLIHQPPRVPLGGNDLSFADGTDEIVWKGVTFISDELPTRPAQIILSDVNATIPMNKWTCIIGATGSGKTTLANSLIRAYDPQEGDVFINGKNLKTVAPDLLRENVVMVPQKTELFACTLLENLILGTGDTSWRKVDKVLQTVCLEEFLLTQERLSQELAEFGDSLSGGQRQRLGLARALYKEPEILILDEYNAHFDPKLAQEVRANIVQNYPNMTVVEISHDIQKARLADHLLVVADGTVVQSGVPDELVKVEGPFQTLIFREMI